jgi:superfamily II DNA or RNA helicase
MTISLYPHQRTLIGETREALADHRSVLVQLPTGGGKTVVASFMAGSAAKRGKRVTFACHRKELITQTAKTFDRVGIPYGIIAAGVTGDRRQPVQIASIPTLNSRFDRYDAPDLYIVDEAHHAGAKTWADVIDAYKAKGSFVVGLSATPERLVGTGLGKWFNSMVRGPSTGWLIENGFLSPYRLFAPSSPDLSGVKRIGGDFNKKELEERVGTTAVTGNAVEHYRKIAHGKRAMVFCVSIKHSLAVVEQFQAAGYRAAHIDGESQDRERLIADFTAGRIEVLSSVDLVSEGFDLPAIEVAILLRPTDSLSLFIQQVGRALRVAPGKSEAIILDHAGNSRPKEDGGRGHGMPCEEREWTLDGRVKRKRGGNSDEPSAPVRQCPSCYRVHPPAPTCVNCGHVYPSLGRTVTELEGELAEVEIAAARLATRKDQGRAKTLDDLVKQGRARGMRNPAKWAENVLKGREEKRENEEARTLEDLVRIGRLRGRKDPQAWAEKVWAARNETPQRRH